MFYIYIYFFDQNIKTLLLYILDILNILIMNINNSKKNYFD